MCSYSPLKLNIAGSAKEKIPIFLKVSAAAAGGG